MEFGKVEYLCISRKNGDAPVVRKIYLTLVGQGDEDVLVRHGIRALRLKRIVRLTSEAAGQGCLLGYEDLSALLLTSLATLKRDVASLEAAGEMLLLKGRRKGSNGNGNGKSELKEPALEAGPVRRQGNEG